MKKMLIYLNTSKKDTKESVKRHSRNVMQTTNEKLAIIDDPDKNLLNKRSEVISQCRHRNKFKLVNLMSCKTPNDII